MENLLEKEINEKLKLAMFSKNKPVVDVLRMLKMKIMEKIKSPGFSGVLTDDMTRDIISAYKKSLQKAIIEYGASGSEAKTQLEFEIGACEEFLPKQMDEDTLRLIMAERIKVLQISSPNHIGRLIGDITKNHKGLVDGGTVKKIATDLLKVV